MQFIDLAAQQQRIADNINERIQAVLAHGKYIMGPEVQEIEERLGQYIGIQHSISCSSGTDALLLALMALNVKPGDAVFAPTFTFIATVEVVSILGATPVFVDIDPKTYNIDPEKLEQAIEKTNNTSLTAKGVIAVDLFGLPADYKRIKDLAGKHGLFVIGDAAQSFGAEVDGKKAAAFSDISCTSFFPAKPLGCYGDGGMCFTDDDHLAEVMRSLRFHGKGTHKYDNARIGVNGRLDTIQAAILNSKFDLFAEEVELRQEVARRYTHGLSENNLHGLVVPVVPDSLKSVWAQYSILSRDEKQRSGIQARLKVKDIPTAIYYPKPLHLQTAFNDLGYQDGDFPVSEDCAKRIFSIPMHPYLTAEDQEMIISTMNE